MSDRAEVVDTAVPPQGNFTLNIYGDIKREQEGSFEALKADDEKWKNFYDSPFFEMVKQYIERLCDKLDDLEGEAFERGAAAEEIVIRRAVARLTKVNLKSVTSKCERTAEQLRKPLS